MDKPKQTKKKQKVRMIGKYWVEEGYAKLSPKQIEKIAIPLSRKKDKVLSIRINSIDLKKIKAKAKKLNVKYQTLITEVLHEISKN